MSRPSIPNHLQKSVVAALPRLIPDNIAEYHTSRARCHKHNQRRTRAMRRPADAQSSNGGDTSARGVTEPVVPPQSPAILDHLVIGINETIKSLERAIDDLRFRMLIIADTLNGTLQPGREALPVTSNGLLPTAPTTSKELGPALGFVIIPLLSVSPQSLVSPILQYCATYNALVYQWSQLKKNVETRLKRDQWGILGEAREEVRVVPLGDVEAELATMVGLRRAACIGVKVST